MALPFNRILFLILTLFFFSCQNTSPLKTQRCEINSSSIKIKENQNIVQPTSIIDCHNDHRIVMSIAPLCMKIDYVKFDDKEVVNKSYPKFWEDIDRVSKNNN